MMKHLRKFGFLAVPLGTVGLLAASAAANIGFSDYALVRAQRVNVGDGNMSVVAPRPWNRHRRILFEDIARRRGLDS